MRKKKCHRSLPDVRPHRGANPHFSAQLFGELIRDRRDSDGRSLEELAPLAGLTPAEWVAIEEGEAPGLVEQVYLLAAALRLGDSWLVPMVRLCAQAHPGQ
jgi:transcriptional regulator with XRE-family HTH domain